MMSRVPRKKLTLLPAGVILLLLLVMPQSARAQGKIYTRKTKIEDFPTKTTMVILSGDSILDLALREEVRRGWRISPFEFCDSDEYAAISSDENYYFLYLSEDKSSLAYLTLMKGGKGQSFLGKEGSLKVISIPFAAADMSTGRELVFLPALLDIVQNYVEEAITSETKAYLGLGVYNGHLIKQRGKTIFVANDDLCPALRKEDLPSSLAPGFVVADDYMVDSLFNAGAKDALIAFCVAPSAPSKRARSYQMIVDAQTHELYYINSHCYREASRRGFLKRELKYIRKQHAYRKKKK